MPRRKVYTLKSAKTQDGAVAIELENKSKFFLEREVTQPKAPTFRWHWWYALVGVVLFLLGLAGSLVTTAMKDFERAAETNVWGVASVVWAGLKSPYFDSHQRLTLLLLGTDAVANRVNTTLLTDTLMLISIEPNGAITSVSLPRDLYIPELGIKINALYESGLLTNTPLNENPAKSVISSISGVEIDYVLVVELNTVKALIDALGGVNVTVAKDFEDTQYPREDADLTSTDPAELYETVQFTAGPTIMDGDRALKFIRSRHSADLEEGTDDARVRRQHLVLTALLNKLITKSKSIDSTFYGSLYKIWKTKILTDVPDTVLVGVGRSLMGKDVRYTSRQIPTVEDADGLLSNPPLTKYGAWVYEANDPTWQDLQAWFAQQLNH